MTKLKEAFALVFFCSSICLKAQKICVTEKVHVALNNNCPGCFLRSPHFYNPLGITPAADSATRYYHECHTLLEAGKLQEASLFAQLAIITIKDTVNDPLYPGILFLQAKINDCQNSQPAAITHYTHFLTRSTTDSSLNGDAFASLTRIFLSRQNWGNATYYLHRWYPAYTSFLSDETKRSIYDSVAYIFYASKKVNNPEVAIQTGIEFFITIRDTNRLMTLYETIGNWYLDQSLYSEATVYFKKGLASAVLSKNYEAQKKLYSQLALLEEKRERWKMALYYRKAYESTDDSIRTADKQFEKDNRQKKSHGVNSPIIAYNPKATRTGLQKITVLN